MSTAFDEHDGGTSAGWSADPWAAPDAGRGAHPTALIPAGSDDETGPDSLPLTDHVAGFRCSRCGTDRAALVFLTRNACGLCGGAEVPREPAYLEREGRPREWAVAMRRQAIHGDGEASLDLFSLASEYDRREAARIERESAEAWDRARAGMAPPGKSRRRARKPA